MLNQREVAVDCVVEHLFVNNIHIMDKNIYKDIFNILNNAKDFLLLMGCTTIDIDENESYSNTLDYMKLYGQWVIKDSTIVECIYETLETCDADGLYNYIYSYKNTPEYIDDFVDTPNTLEDIEYNEECMIDESYDVEEEDDFNLSIEPIINLQPYVRYFLGENNDIN